MFTLLFNQLLAYTCVLSAVCLHLFLSVACRSKNQLFVDIKELFAYMSCLLVSISCLKVIYHKIVSGGVEKIAFNCSLAVPANAARATEEKFALC